MVRYCMLLYVFGLETYRYYTPGKLLFLPHFSTTHSRRLHHYTGEARCMLGHLRSSRRIRIGLGEIVSTLTFRQNRFLSLNHCMTACCERNQCGKTKF